MKKLNIANTLYLIILIGFVVATIIKVMNYKGWDRYYYGASVTVPALYPVYIRDAYFLLPDGESYPVSTSNANYRQGISKWGEPGHNSPTTRERLPVKLVLKYASYRNSSFYADTISLPQNILHQAFTELSPNGIDTDLYGGQSVRRLDFLIGIANNGYIIVWLWGAHKELVLVKHQIKPHEPVGDDTYHDGRLPKADYLRTVFDVDSAAKAAIEKGMDGNANYIDTPSAFHRIDLK